MPSRRSSSEIVAGHARAVVEGRGPEPRGPDGRDLRRADLRVPATVDALAGTVSGDLDSPSIRATELIYVASMLEQAKMFEVVDRLVQLFESGRLPIRRGLATEKITTYAKATALRMSARERRAVYRRVLGTDAAGDDTSNRGFNDLWLRFLSAVAS